MQSWPRSSRSERRCARRRPWLSRRGACAIGWRAQSRWPSSRCPRRRARIRRRRRRRRPCAGDAQSTSRCVARLGCNDALSPRMQVLTTAPSRPHRCVARLGCNDALSRSPSRSLRSKWRRRPWRRHRPPRRRWPESKRRPRGPACKCPPRRWPESKRRRGHIRRRGRSQRLSSRARVHSRGTLASCAPSYAWRPLPYSYPCSRRTCAEQPRPSGTLSSPPALLSMQVLTTTPPLPHITLVLVHRVLTTTPSLPHIGTL